MLNTGRWRHYKMRMTWGHDNELTETYDISDKAATPQDVMR